MNPICYLSSQLCRDDKNSKPFVWKKCAMLLTNLQKKKSCLARENMRACIVLEIMVFRTGISLTSVLVKQCDAWWDQGRHGSVIGVDFNVTVYNYSSISRSVLFCSLKTTEFTISMILKFLISKSYPLKRFLQIILPVNLKHLHAFVDMHTSSTLI